MPSPLGEGQMDMPIAQANQGEVQKALIRKNIRSRKFLVDWADRSV